MHAWLHLVDLMEKSGPLIFYWCFVMERFCGRLSRAITSCRFPYPSLDRRVVEHQSLQIMRNTYDLQDRLPNYTMMHNPANMPEFTSPAYEDITLLHPRTVMEFANRDLGHLKIRVAACLATRYSKLARIVKPLIPAVFVQWARVQITDGDRVNPHLGYSRKESSRRDATFIEYRQRVDLNARSANAIPDFHWRPMFGQLDRIIVFDIPPNPIIKNKRWRTYVFLDVHCAATTKDRHGFYEYKELGRHEVIDASCLRAVVGRIFDRGSWVIVRRGDGKKRSDYVSADEDY